MEGHVYLIGDPNLTLTLMQLKFAMAGLCDGGPLGWRAATVKEAKYAVIYDKSFEIIFVRLRSGSRVAIPLPAVQGFARVQTVKPLGVTLMHNLPMTAHVNETLVACAKTLFAQHGLRAHGLPPPALHAIFQARALAKLTYASPT
jgi:hypothetical protein